MRNRTTTVVSRVAEQLGTALADVVEAMDAAAEETWPTFPRPGADGDDVRAGFRRIALLFVRVLEERRELGPEELVAVHVVGAQRARQGMPADHVVDRMRAALRALWERVLDLAAAEDGGPAGLTAIRELSLFHIGFTHAVLDALETGYATEREQRLTGRLRAQVDFVDRMLEGQWDDDDEIRSQASALGHQLGRLCGLLMLLPAGGHDTEALRSSASRLVRGLPAAIEGPIRTLPALHVVVVLPVASADAWDEALEAAGTMAQRERLVAVPMEPTAHLNAIAYLYRRAQRYLPLAFAARTSAGVVTVKDLRLYAVLTGIPLADRVDFVRDMLGPVLDLPAHKSDELLDTLDAVYRRRGRIAEAAADLHLHQNSVRYRLNRIEQLTGLSLDVPADRMHLELAMRLRWVARAELATLDDPSPPRLRARPA